MAEVTPARPQILSLFLAEAELFARLQTCPTRGLDSLAGYPIGVVGSQKRCDGSDVLRLPNAAERCFCLSLFLEVAADEAGCVDAFGFNHSRVQRVDAD